MAIYPDDTTLLVSAESTEYVNNSLQELMLVSHWIVNTVLKMNCKCVFFWNYLELHAVSGRSQVDVGLVAGAILVALDGYVYILVFNLFDFLFLLRCGFIIIGNLVNIFTHFHL